MSASHELEGILQQWLELTRQEGAAIASAKWARLEQIQEQKARLPALFSVAAEDRSSFPEPLRKLAGRIVSMLTRNGELLAARLRETRSNEAKLEIAHRVLRQVHGSYTRRPVLAAWQSYS